MSLKKHFYCFFKRDIFVSHIFAETLNSLALSSQDFISLSKMFLSELSLFFIADAFRQRIQFLMCWTFFFVITWIRESAQAVVPLQARLAMWRAMRSFQRSVDTELRPSGDYTFIKCCQKPSSNLGFLLFVSSVTFRSV